MSAQLRTIPSGPSSGLLPPQAAGSGGLLPVEGAASAARVTPLSAYAVFHLNLMFSSIETEARGTVIDRCYRPLLDLAEHGSIPVGIEATGLTLEFIDALAPDVIRRMRRLAGNGAIELIGSGYAQTIAPLLPAEAVRRNLMMGQETVARILGVAPAIALVNEQAWSGGIVAHYRDAGFSAVIADWDNAAQHHAEWPKLWRYYPQIARGADGAEIPVLWSNTIAFQKLQRYAHGDITLDAYLDYVASHADAQPRTLALYTNDAECFDFRPGRFMTEERIHGEGEWARLSRAFAAMKEDARISFVRPSEALPLLAHPQGGKRLKLETPENPTPVKKQLKYNITRWAVSGRDDFLINSLCWKAFRALDGNPDATVDHWRELLYLWSSDFRTHITRKRWDEFLERLNHFITTLPAPPAKATAAAPPVRHAGISQHGRFIDVDTGVMRVRLDARRGLAIDAMGFAGAKPLVGGLPHGAIDDITLAADWYTGNAVLEVPGEAKVTDLEPLTPDIRIDAANGDALISGVIDTRLGPISKTMRIHAGEPRVSCETVFDWPVLGKGSLRLGHVTLKPDAFDASRLSFSTHNGGAMETCRLSGHSVNLGAPVSYLVSAQSGVGMTEGMLEASDGTSSVRLEIDQAEGAMIGLVEHKPIEDSFFCRLMLSALEVDDTRKPEGLSGPRRLCWSLVIS
ncbi:MAG TPA: hypothetical protein PL096_02760 [Micropepsaceae bacterium]|nr:hypothetical protein [Micropepsaceae bacterium]